ncbi:class I SAM-dependent methyltransferase [Brevibacillus ginsengisoli]|uniref:class I SAM-dependent methyltransferase n=1 Tax=Brevibacillus ginsengisoli TaxID=363854 RepID=UPI003CF9B038
MRAMHEKLYFLYKFMRSPKQIGSVTPSSVFLARKMLEPLKGSQVASVAELGAGTGAITRHIATVLQRPTKVLLFEKDPYLRSRLKDEFPNYSCQEDACNLQEALKEVDIDSLDCILSGLPFFNFPSELREQLMREITAALKPGGLFIAFQYSQQMRKRISQDFEIECVHFVPLNFPPAFVYVCRKRGSSLHEL